MKKQLLFAAAALALAGCNKQEVSDSWNGEIRLFSSQLVTRAATDIQSTQFDKDAVIDVYINEDVATGTQTTTNYDSPIEYTVTDASGTMTCATGVYFPSSGNGVTIHALYPAGAGSDFTVAEDQSEADNYKKSDLMFGLPQAGNPVSRQQAAIPLTFNHKLSKIIVTLTPGDGLTANDLQGAKVSIVSAVRNVSVDLTTGILSAPATATTGNVRIATITDITAMTGAGIIPPQSFTSGSQFIEVALTAGGKLYYTLPADITLNEGKVYKYEIKANLTGLTLKSQNIVDWATETGEGAYTGENGDAYM